MKYYVANMLVLVGVDDDLPDQAIVSGVMRALRKAHNLAYSGEVIFDYGVPSGGLEEHMAKVFPDEQQRGILDAGGTISSVEVRELYEAGQVLEKIKEYKDGE